jgi:uncharacterized protein (TIGR00725 family)
MRNLYQKPKIGVMASARFSEIETEAQRLIAIAARLGEVIAERDCLLVTGATTGIPDVVSRAARKKGGMAIGISPATCKEEHVSRYALPDDGVDLIIYTGFGLKW